MAYNRGRLIGASGITSSNTNSSGIFYASEVAPLIDNLSFDAKEKYFDQFVKKRGGLSNTWYQHGADSSYGLYYEVNSCMFVSSNGENLYILRRRSFMGIDQYKMKIPGDPNSMYYYGSFNIKGVTSQAETNSYAFTLSHDGSKLFIHGITLDDLFSYDLGTSWDITTVDITTLSKKTDWYTSYIYDMKFNNDGTKLFTASYVNNSVFEHSLTTAYDVTTIESYSTKKLSDYATQPDHNSANIPNPYCIQFNEDGTKLFVTFLRREGRIYEYELTTAFDLSTASLSDQHVIGTWENYSGFYYFAVCNNGNDLIYKTYVADPNFFGHYKLQVPWDLSSSPWQDFHRIENNPSYAGLLTEPSGNKIWYLRGQTSVASGTGNIIEARFGTAWDANTIYYTGNNFDTHAIGYTCYGATWGSNGQYLYAVSEYTDFVGRWTASSPYDITTLSADYDSIYIGSQEAQPRGISFNISGTEMQISGIGDDAFNTYTLSTAWDITTATHSQGPVLQSGAKNYMDHKFSTDGTKVYRINYSDDSVYQWPLSTAFDPSSNTSGPTTFSVSAQEATPCGLAFKTDGTKMYIYGATQQEIHGYDLSTAWDISTATYTSQEQNENYLHGLYIANTGQYMFATDYDGGKIWRISTTANNVFDSRANTDMYFDVSAQSANPQDVHFKSDGTEMFVLQYNDQYLDKYTLSSAWDITTATYDSTSTSLGAASTGIRGFTMTEDGTKLFVMSTTADDIHRFDMSTAYDVNTAVKHTGELYLADSDYSGLWISKDGKKLYTCHRSMALMLQFGLDTAYDLSTANSHQNIVLNHSTYRDPDLGGIAFTNSGNSFYVSSMSSGQGDWRTSWIGDATVAYRLDTNWDMATTNPLWQTSGDWYRFGTTNTNRANAPTNDGGVVHACNQNPGCGLYQFIGTTRDNSSNTSVLPSTITSPSETREIYDRIKYAKDISLYCDEIINIEFGDGGNKFYVVAYGTYGFISQFSCSSPYDIGDLTLEKTLNLETIWRNDFTSVNPQYVTHMSFADNGNVMLITDYSGDKVTKYDLATPYDICSGTPAGQVDVTTPEGTPRAAFFNKDGDELYVMGTNTDKINVFKCTTAFSVNTATYTSGDQIVITPRTSDVYDMKFTPDYSKIVYQDYYYRIREAFIGSANGTISSLSTPVGNTNYNTSLVDSDGYSTSTMRIDNSQHGVHWDHNGEFALIVGVGSSASGASGSLQRCMEFKNTLTYDDIGYGTPNATSLARNITTDNGFGQGTSGIVINPNTSGMGTFENSNRSGRVDGGGPKVWWAMPLAQRASNGNGTIAITGRHYGLWGAGSDKVVSEFSNCQYNVYNNYAGPFRNRLTYSSASFTFTNGANRHGLSFKRDGTRIYTSDTNGVFYENHLSTAWDVTTIDSASTPVGSFDTGIYYRAFDIDNDGKYLWAVIDNSKELTVYELTTPWDISSMVFRKTLNMPEELSHSVCARNKNVTVCAKDWTTSTSDDNLVMFLDYSSLN